MKGLIIGLIKVILRAILSTDFGKVKESGKKEQGIAINMRDTIRTIRNGAMDSLLGQAATFIKAIIKAMYVVVMEKCIGRMEVIIRESGLMESNTDKVNLPLLRLVIYPRYWL